MRTPNLLTLLLLSVASTAQPFNRSSGPSFQLGVTGGYNMSFAQSSTGTGGFTNTFKSANGANGCVSAAINLSSLQLGVGVEVGSLKGDVSRVMVDKSYEFANTESYLLLLNPPRFLTTATDEPIASPYIAPHLFVHYNASLGNMLNLYTGVLGGLSFSNNYLVADGNANGWIIGANLGVVINVTDRIGIDIHEGFRMLGVGNKKKLNDAPPLNTERLIQGGYYYKTIDHYRFSFLNTNIGLVFKL